MKNLYILIFISLITLSCKAQSPIVNIDGWNGDEITNTYYKDSNNFFNEFEGTWLYTNGTTSFKIVLEKVTMAYTGKFYMDDMKGEYQYIENGVEKINTLQNTNQYKQGIWGADLLKSHHKPPCSTCLPNKRRLSVIFSDRERNLGATLTLQLVTVNGQPAVRGLLYGSGGIAYDENNPPQYLTITVPTGWYTFIKQ